MIYVFCGNQGKNNLNTIERFNARKFLDERDLEYTSWVNIEVP